MNNIRAYSASILDTTVAVNGMVRTIRVVSLDRNYQFLHRSLDMSANTRKRVDRNLCISIESVRAVRAMIESTNMLLTQ